MSILTIDVGTSSIRAAVVDPDGGMRFAIQEPHLPDTPFPGLVEFDGAAMASAVIAISIRAMERAGDVDTVAITNQRASAVIWDRSTGSPVAPGLGWQDLRTIGTCLELRAEGTILAPNLAATKFSAILDSVDPDRSRDLCLGTVDSWIAWTLSNGQAHVTDMSNAAMTGLYSPVDGWQTSLLKRLRLDPASLPKVIDSAGVFGHALALPGAPVMAGILGDQQSSLVGQGCVRPSMGKITFGTGGMLDVLAEPTRFDDRGDHGTFPIIAWGSNGKPTNGVEAVMLAAGTNVEWLRDDLGILSTAAEAHDVASSVPSTDGVWFVPALLGLGTPDWDYGARGTLLGITRGTERAHIVRAVLEGVAHSGADMIAATEADIGSPLSIVRIDGGMSANPTFLQALANAVQRPIEVSLVAESTALGAAYAAGIGTGVWSDWDDILGLYRRQAVIEPDKPDAALAADRSRWTEALDRSRGWFPELSALEF